MACPRGRRRDCRRKKIAQVEEGRGEKRRQAVPAKGARRWKLGETLPPPEWSVPVATWERFSAPAAREGIHPPVVRKTEKKASKRRGSFSAAGGASRDGANRTAGRGGCAGNMHEGLLSGARKS